MRFLDWIHILNTFIISEGNLKTIKRVEEVKNYKLAEFLGRKSQHDPKKFIHIYSSCDLSKAYDL